MNRKMNENKYSPLALIYIIPMFLLVNACAHTTSGTITFNNNNKLKVIAKLTVTDASDTPTFRYSYEVPAAETVLPSDKANGKVEESTKKTASSTLPRSGTYTTPKLTCERKARIKLEYTPDGSSATLPIDEFIVPNSDALFNGIYSIPSVDSLDELATTNQLKDIGGQLGAQGQPLVGKLVDYVPSLTKIIIAKKSADGTYQHVDQVQLQPSIKIEHHDPDTIRQHIYANRDIMTKAKLAVPIYGSIEANMDNSTAYSLNVEVKHYEYINGFDLATSLDAMDRTKLKTLKSLLDKSPTTIILTIDRFHVVDSAVFAMQKGTKISGGANAAILSVLTTNGTFSFSQGEESFVSLAQDVLNVRYKEFGTASEVSAVINGVLTASDKRTVNLKSTTVEASPQFSKSIVSDSSETTKLRP